MNRIQSRKIEQEHMASKKFQCRFDDNIYLYYIHVYTHR